MFANYIMAYLVIGGCVGVLSSVWRKANGSATLEIDETKDKLDELFLVMNLKNGQDEFVKVKDVKAIDLSTAYHLDIPVGIKPSTVIELEEVIETALKRRTRVTKQEYDVFIKVYNRDLPTNLIDIYPKRPATNDLIIPIGYGWDGVVWWQLNSDYPHAYVGGATGSGKSSFTHTTITYVTETYPDVKLLLVDFKGNELNYYKDMRNIEAYVNTLDDVVELIHRIQTEMEVRYSKVTEVDHIDQYNDLHPNDRMERWIVIFDEIFDLMRLDKDEKDVLAAILSKSRACGIHFVFSTQRAVDKVLPNDITTHLSLRVGFRMNSSQESKNLIESNVLSSISKDHKGRGYTNANGELEEFQGYFTTIEKRKEVAKKYQRAISEETKKKRGWFR